MLWLASRDSLYEAAGAPWPTSLPIAERAVLFDGLAAKRLGWNSNLFSLQIPIPASTIRVIGVAGWSVNRPLTAAEAGVRIGSTWQPRQPLVIDGTTAAIVLDEQATGVQYQFTTGVSGTEMTFGEIFFGPGTPLPDPSSVEVVTEVPTIVNGDFAVRVGLPRREVRMAWPPQESRAIEDWVRTYGGETGLLWVDGRPFFGRLGTTVSSLRTIEHDYLELASVSLVEVAGGSLW